MIELDEHPAGIVLRVRAQPGARRREIRGIHAGALRVAVTQVAEKGRANRAVAELLCESLALQRSQLELLSGQTATEKRYLIRGLPAAELAARIRRLVLP